MAQFIILDTDVGVTPLEFASAWNADAECSAEGLLEERQPGQTFDAALLHYLGQAAQVLIYLSAATSLIVNSQKILELLRGQFGGRFSSRESLEIKIAFQR